MKRFKIVLFLALSVCFAKSAVAQKKVIEDTILVEGVCGMCKERIEESAYGKGVKFVNWDKVTDELAIAYRSDKTSLEEIQDRIVKAGHSTENRKAKREDYNDLPECCRYESLHNH